MSEDDLWRRLGRLTPARIGLGRAGAGLPTREVLSFGFAHAQARDAVHTPMDATQIARATVSLGFRTVTVASQAPDRAGYLRRPDWGRRLSPESREVLEEAAGPAVDLAIVVADGLSARAIHEGAAAMLGGLKPRLDAAGWALAPITVAVQARVALGDAIGEALRARAVVVLIGERPGLSSPDSLGIYVTFDPKPGRTDAERNCISNVRPAGLSYELAGFKLHWLLAQAFSRGLTGVALKDESDRALEDAGGRAPPLSPPRPQTIEKA